MNIYISTKKTTLYTNIIVICFCLSASCNSKKPSNTNEQKNTIAQKYSSNDTIKKHVDDIIILCNRLNIFSSKEKNIMDNNYSGTLNDADDSTMNMLGDSIDKNNAEIISSLIKYSNYFSESDLSTIKSNTHIRIVSSLDKKIVFYSWDDGKYAPPPLVYYNNILSYSTNKKRVSIYCNTNKVYSQLRENMSIDSICQTKFNDKPLYLVFGSNICGSACASLKLVPLLFTDDNYTDTNKVFELNGISYNKLELSYYINENIENPIAMEFNTEKNTVSVPILNKNKDKVLGKSIYQIGGK